MSKIYGAEPANYLLLVTCRQIMARDEGGQVVFPGGHLEHARQACHHVVEFDAVAVLGLARSAQVADRLSYKLEGAFEELEAARHARAGGMEGAELIGLHNCHDGLRERVGRGGARELVRGHVHGATFAARL